MMLLDGFGAARRGSCNPNLDQWKIIRGWMEGLSCFLISGRVFLEAESRFHLTSEPVSI